MKTILIPTDFSETSRNASLYAVKMASSIKIPKVVFYHFYETHLIYSPTGVLDELASIEPGRVKSSEGLEAFVASLGEIPDDVEVEMYHGAGSVTEGVEEVAKLTNADLVILGIKSGSIFNEALLGLNTLSLIKFIKTPVLIVPSTSNFKKYEKITFLSDFKNIENTPVAEMNTLFENGKVDFSVLHLQKRSETQADISDAKSKLEKILSKYHPSFHIKESHHYTDDIIDFISQNQIDIFCIIPREHNLLQTIFNNHTSNLAHHIQVPLLVVHH